MPNVPLSPGTSERLKAVFPNSDRAEAERLLVEHCSSNLPFFEDANALSLERIRFAAIKVSGGNVGTLREAIDLANIDWRDLLVWAGFADDAQAHKNWTPPAAR